MLEKNVQEKDILWDDAKVYLVISDIKGLQTQAKLVLGKASQLFEPAVQTSGMQAMVGNILKASPTSLPFEVTLQLNGSRGVYFAPLGKESVVNIDAPWSSPSFVGAYLPTEREVTDKKFHSQWKTAYFSRNYGQNWSSNIILNAAYNEVTATQPTYYDRNRFEDGVGVEQRSVEPAPSNLNQAVSNSMFGVSLINTVDFYQQSERSTKYGVLFLALTFLTFFLFEIVTKARVHFIQYTIVGLALCLFYLLLIATSEVVGFLWAYIIASGAIVSMISYYSVSITQNKRLRIIMPALLSALYLYLYILLQLEDLSLLVGAIGLFLAMAGVMVVTRNVDWYNTEGPSS